jgi:hypothetical protein
MAKMPKPKELKPWDRRPWPPHGDTDQEKLYAGVGRALSEWERYDARLSFLFAAFTSQEDNAIGRRAYSAVRTFEGRRDMLRAASEAYFVLHPNKEFLAAFKEILRNAATFSERRNDISHGAVDHYRPEPPTLPPTLGGDEYALFPSFATFRTRNVNNEPTYCYTSAELEYFRQQFYELRRPVADLAALLAGGKSKFLTRRQ